MDEPKTYRIIELNTLTGVPGKTSIHKVEAKSVAYAIKNFYELFPEASNDIMIVLDEHVTEFNKNIRPRVIVG